jgi:hypothetical protein
MSLSVRRYALLLCITFFIPVSHAQQYYPNVPGQVLLDDERVTVQRFVLEPGQWEGVHAHPEYQLVIVLSSSDELTYRYGEKETVFSYPDGQPDKMSTFWRPPVELTAEHESGNTGTRPLEWVAITFKGDSIATDSAPTQILDRELNK